jgi:hypothetical protein
LLNADLIVLNRHSAPVRLKPDTQTEDSGGVKKLPLLDVP